MSYSIQFPIMRRINNLEITYPIITWIIFCICISAFIFIDFSKNNIKKRDIFIILFMFIWLIYLTIKKSSGLLIIPCIVTYILLFGIISYKFYIYKKENKINTPTTNNKKPKKQKSKKSKKRKPPNNQKIDLSKITIKSYNKKSNKSTDSKQDPKGDKDKI